MKVLLIDIDRKYRPSRARGKIIPNLALMKLSAHFKHLYAEVGFDIQDPDIVYISAVFSRNSTNAHYEYYRHYASGALVSMGGSGISYDITLPKEIECVKPDYSLYPSTYSQGFTTRGCIRSCPFCIVNRKEGKISRHQHIQDFVDFRFREVMLMDNNILADKDWFFVNTIWAEEHNLRIIIPQGLDVRLLTPEIAEHLKCLHFKDSQIRFAFDNLSDEEYVRAGINMLRDAGINCKRNVSFYVLSGFNTTFSEDKYRCDLLKDLGVNAFLMIYRKTGAAQAHLARWANRRPLYWTSTSNSYLESKVVE